MSEICSGFNYNGKSEFKKIYNECAAAHQTEVMQALKKLMDGMEQLKKENAQMKEQVSTLTGEVAGLRQALTPDTKAIKRRHPNNDTKA